MPFKPFRSARTLFFVGLVAILLVIGVFTVTRERVGTSFSQINSGLSNGHSSGSSNLGEGNAVGAVVAATAAQPNAPVPTQAAAARPTAPQAAPAAPQVQATAPASAPTAPVAPRAESTVPPAPPTPPMAINPFIRTTDDNLSTFAMDVDTASYSAARRYLLESNQLPPADMVRVEEFVNALNYAYPQPSDTFGVTVDAAPAPFLAANSRLVRVGIQGMHIDSAQRKPAALTFVIDVSGSMEEAQRLPLVKQALAILVEQLREDDTVAIVAYGSNAFTVLEPTSASAKPTIISAINALKNEGSTNAEGGLRLAYEVAGRAFKREASNRVILCSDGVANVGATGPAEILAAIRDRAAQGIYLTTVGFGMGDYNDQLMEQLANDGNGNYAYVDTLEEARRIFVENLTGTLQVIAKDAKIQVVFNPAVVSQYRLLGYENRAVADADFRNDRVDAGEVGAGHSVTALYEVILTEQSAGEALSVQVRWADPQSGTVRELNQPFASTAFGATFAATPANLRLAAAVAALAEHLRASPYAQSWSLADVGVLVAQLAADQPNNAQLQELHQMVVRAVQLGA